jgi:predicted metal-binding membrane protein
MPSYPSASARSPLLDWVIPRRWQLQDTIVLLALGLVVVLSWSWLIAGAGVLMTMGDMSMPMSSGAWTATEASLMFAMWVAMMAAMMLPGVLPTILLYCAVTRNHRASVRTAEWLSFISGYFAVWILFSAVAVALQYLLEQAAYLDAMMQMTNLAVSGLVLLFAGIYQWWPLKQGCLSKCQSPLDALMRDWKSGPAGALKMGWRNGAQCLGCCWAWMLVLFVVGVMNLAWVAALALLMAVEKLSPLAAWGSRIVGLALMVWGGALLVQFL